MPKELRQTEEKRRQNEQNGLQQHITSFWHKNREILLSRVATALSVPLATRERLRRRGHIGLLRRRVSRRLYAPATTPFSQNFSFSSGIFSRRCRLFVFNRFTLFLASFYPEHLQKPKDSIIYKNYIKTTQTDSIIIQNMRRK